MRRTINLSLVTLCLCQFSLAAEKYNSRQDNALPEMGFVWLVPDKTPGGIIAELAKSQGKNPDPYLTYRRGGVRAPFDMASSATLVQANGKRYALVVQTVSGHGIPDTSAQQVLLVTANGEVLDRLGCDINSRYGETKTEVLQTPEGDGAQVVIRFLGEKALMSPTWWHACHSICYHGKSYTFWVKQNEDKPTIWNEKGLCRAKIANDKFEVIFPKLETPDK